MNPTDPLARLNPLREPAAIDWWPPAPGWWLLAVLLLCGCIALALWSWRRHRRNRYRAQGLAALAAIEAEYRRDRDAAALAGAVNALLKTVALKAFPRTTVAGLHGEAWAGFLNDTGDRGQAFDAAMASAHYRAASDLDCAALCDQAARWIRRHRGLA